MLVFCYCVIVYLSLWCCFDCLIVLCFMVGFVWFPCYLATLRFVDLGLQILCGVWLDFGFAY